MADPLAGLAAAARSLLADPPVTEKKLVELRAEQPSLPPAEAELADAVRQFVITWDPLETSPSRPPAFAAVNAGPLELAVYLPCWSLAAFVAAHGMTMAAVLAAAAASVVTTGAAHLDVLLSGDYPNLAARGQAPDLVGDLARPAGRRDRGWRIRQARLARQRPRSGGRAQAAALRRPRCRRIGMTSGSA